MTDLLTLAATTASGLSLGITEGGSWLLRNAWLIPALPALSFLGILFFGKRMPRGGSELGIALVGIAFVLSLLTAAAWIDHRDNFEGEEVHRAVAADEGHADEGHAAGHPSLAVHNTVTWFELNDVTFTAGTLVDGPAVMMLVVVTLVSLLVHVYSTEYVAGDPRYTHFFAFLSLFSASMLLLVVSENTLQLLVSWELVGVCSFVLIGHWWEEKPNSDAALKAFLTNRVGDMGLIVGVAILFFTVGSALPGQFGSFSIAETNALAGAGRLSHTALLVASCCLMAAVMSKSGQFLLHTWLPDAMAGPTPVSALIHAATMVVAGVFMIARMYGVFFEGFSIGGSSINLMALIGGLTTLVGACLAFVQRDIKKVLAYSTISQLGYMVMALGVGAWTAALFHLFTHAFFKACLFLGSGSAAHAVHSFDMKSDMGGLRKHMPHTYRTFVIGSIALAGLPPLAGFWSKDEILVGTGGWGLFGGTGGNGAYTFMLVMGVTTAALTAAYMTRCIYLTFFGEFRGHGTPHESGPRIVVPLWILAGLAIVAGLLNLPKGFPLVPGSLQERFGHFVEPVAAYFPSISHGTPSWSLAIASTLVVLSGIAVAGWYYFVKVEAASKAAGESLTELPDGLTSRYPLAKMGHTFLVQKYYLDHLYTDIIAGGTKGPVAAAAYKVDQDVIDGVVNAAGENAVKAGNLVYHRFDQLVVDGIVNTSGRASSGAGGELRKIQTGKVQDYAAILFAAATVLAGILIVIV
ncbi:MAG: NADH-quinone oxidoreductase subunit L [Acidimicrobiales bacterium]|nr:NADH-quinone oxidoreductase subunit L [Acidimicrobiales bacterium]MDP6649424.1 NADH-quinone oxidoreductase subunit L [Acidimicrobiales bacterium]